MNYITSEYSHAVYTGFGKTYTPMFYNWILWNCDVTGDFDTYHYLTTQHLLWTGIERGIK